MTSFNSAEALRLLKPVLNALGKTQAKKSQLSISSNTAGTSLNVTGDGVRISFHTPDTSDVAFSKTYVLSDIDNVISLDKTRFELEMDEDMDMLNDVPIFAVDPTLVETGSVIATAEVDDVSPFANKPMLPAINKLLKKSLIRESEYLLWRVQPEAIELCQIFPTDWGVRGTFDGDYGVKIEAFTNKLENKLIFKLLSGRFKITSTDHGYVFEDNCYSIFVSKKVGLRAELYPPFN